MEFEDLKAAWQAYDTRLRTTAVISDRLINSMIKERSHSRLARVQREHALGTIYLLCWLGIGLCIIGGNPFDYTQTIEYLPVYGFCIAVIIFTFGTVRTTLRLKKVDILQGDLDSTLRETIRIVEKHYKPGAFLDLSLKLLISAAVLFPLSFLPRKIASQGLWPALVDILILIGISVAMLFIAKKLGAFRQQHTAKLQAYRDELNELKRLSENLNA